MIALFCYQRLALRLIPDKLNFPHLSLFRFLHSLKTGNPRPDELNLESSVDTYNRRIAAVACEILARDWLFGRCAAMATPIRIEMLQNGGIYVPRQLFDFYILTQSFRRFSYRKVLCSLRMPDWKRSLVLIGDGVRRMTLCCRPWIISLIYKGMIQFYYEFRW